MRMLTWAEYHEDHIPALYRQMTKEEFYDAERSQRIKQPEMGEDQQIEFLKQDIKGAKYKRESFGNQKRSRILEYFLNWPYQDYFMKTAGLMWEFLPERDYAVLLLRICDKIKPRKEVNLKYVEFSLPEEEINQLKKEIIYSEDGRRACVYLISSDKKVKAVDQFIKWCFPSEEVKAFKKELVFSVQGTGKCASLVEADQLERELVDGFINFCLSSEEEVIGN
ncbi:ANK_REP_REGION domain-containing protein [Trichonephila inaurata madagascariensis]|uniref:ANK_REP_REGION domain-containing protein n=1 Tax=Trichonephila inaurata madagascariensis TaxID=2747483 RepID=A0A8X7CJY7_9ARAC|nr:ANK_REP_REGION domain-containing protein [Trichonephila inaurata madagascariensis]